MAYLNTTTATHNTFAASAASMIQGLVTRYKRHRLFRRTFDEMSLLSNRELTDLGLSRSELRFIAWESAKAANL